jgi:hypothetical protein
MNIKNNLLPGGDLRDYTSPAGGGAVDSLGIKYNGPILGGMVTGMDALLRSTTRANPLDPFNVEGETWNVEDQD